MVQVTTNCKFVKMGSFEQIQRWENARDARFPNMVCDQHNSQKGLGSSGLCCQLMDSIFFPPSSISGPFS